MRRLKKLSPILILVALLLLVAPAAAQTTYPLVWAPEGLTGGAAGSLDSVSISLLSDGALAFAADSGQNYIYKFDASSSDSESVPDIIVPDDRGAGTGAWMQLQNDTNSVVGMIGMWPSGTPPPGWLECDGSAISRTTYADLWDVLNGADTTGDYGNGDGSTTFNLPDYRGAFLRGWDHGAGTDPDAGSRSDRGDSVTGDYVGTQQAGQNDAHTHNLSGANPLKWSGSYYKVWTTGSGDSAYVDSVSTTASSAGGSEARPVNINIMYMIYYGG